MVNEVRVEKLVYGGDALARMTDGRVALVPFVLPGEHVRLEVVSAKAQLVHARATERLIESPERVAPACPHFEHCGGCQYQHAAYGYQVSQKVSILREVLERVGKIRTQVEIGTVIGPEWAYRNRVQLHFHAGKLGYHAPGSHQLCAIESCPLASPKLAEAIAMLRQMMRDRRWPKFIRSMELFTNETDMQVNVLDSGPARVNRGFFEWCAGQMPGVLASSIEYPAQGRQLRVSHRSFFQTNRFLVDPLCELVLGDATGASALDLYAGVGLFSLPLADRFEQVTAVEAVNSAVFDLEHNAARHHKKIQTVRSRTEDYLAKLTEAPDFVLADPPRAGLGKEAVEALARLKPRRLMIVSCDPATLARDMSALLAAGYAIDGMTMIDLFPHTSHIEVAVALRIE